MSRIRLGGWSFGGLVALEMVRYLRGKGHEVAVGFAIDSALHWTATEMLGALNAETGLEQIVCRFLREIGYGPQEVNSLLTDMSQGSFFGTLCAAFRSHVLAASRYRPSSYEEQFTLILADFGTALDTRSVLGWRAALGDYLDERNVRGTHWSILGEPAVAGLAAVIADLLVNADKLMS